MKKRVLLLGLGNFGRSWANEVLPQCGEFADFVGVVDKNEEMHKLITVDVPYYTELETAITAATPDIVVNVTAPKMHTKINEFLMGKGIAVLCEKPISYEMADAHEMLEFANETDIPLMISENYRYKTIFRECRKWIEEGKIGKIHGIRCQFSHYHPDYSMFYHGTLAHPLLTDVTIHHLDLARYLTGEEPEQVFCKEWGAPYTWYGERPANAMIWTKMSNDVVFEYSGSLAAAVSSTDWFGDWEIAGELGCIRLRGEKLSLFTRENEPCEVVEVSSEFSDTRVSVLKEFVSSITEQRPGETSIQDNFKTFEWMEKAIESSVSGACQRI